ESGECGRYSPGRAGWRMIAGPFGGCWAGCVRNSPKERGRNMRKLCWGCMAAGLVALGLIQAANYACRHPDSVIARCAAGAYYAGMYLVPINYFRSSTGGNNAEEAIDIPADPEPIADESYPVESATIDAIRDAETIRDYDSSGSGRLVAEWPVSHPENKDRGRLPGKIVIEDCEDLPKPMPVGPISPEPNLDRFVERVEAQWMADDAGV